MARVRGADGLTMRGVIDCHLTTDHPESRDGLPVLILHKPGEGQYECDVPEFPTLEAHYERPLSAAIAAEYGIELSKYTCMEDPLPQSSDRAQAQQQWIALAERFDAAVRSWRR